MIDPITAIMLLNLLAFILVCSHVCMGVKIRELKKERDAARSQTELAIEAFDGIETAAGEILTQINTLNNDHKEIEIHYLEKNKALGKEHLALLEELSENNEDNQKLLDLATLNNRINDLLKTYGHFKSSHFNHVLNKMGELALILGFTYNPVKKDGYGEMLQEKRSLQALTIPDLAEKIGVSEEYLVKVEGGMLMPTDEQKEVLESFLNCK